MLNLTVARPELDALLTALRFLEENLERLPREFIELNEGHLLDEVEIENLCARLSDVGYRDAA